MITVRPQRTLAAVLEAQNQLVVRNVPLPPTLEPHQVFIRITNVGICASDIKYWRDGVCGQFRLKQPMVIGHEASGIILELGEKVTGLKVDDCVAIEPGLPCRRCHDACLQGRYNLCSNMRFCATPPVDGNLAEYFVHDEQFCHKLPSEVDLQQGALVEPLAVAVYSCERGEVTLGTDVLIFGAGPVGLMSLAVARQQGASNVTVVDIDPMRLEMATRMGATSVVNGDSLREEDLSRALTAVSPDRGWRAVLECSGADQSVRLGLAMCRSGGRVVLVGRGSPEPSLQVSAAISREVDIVGVFRYVNCFPKAISLLASGAIDLEALITHKFRLIEAERAFETAADSRNNGALKVMLQCFVHDIHEITSGKGIV